LIGRHVIMLYLLLFSFLTLVAYLLLTWIYGFSGAILGHWFGVRVLRVAIGLDVFGRHMISWQGRHWEWRIGLLPFGGYTSFKGIDEEFLKGNEVPNNIENSQRLNSELAIPSDSLQAAGMLKRTALMLVGPNLCVDSPASRCPQPTDGTTTAFTSHCRPVEP
jgi:membrane-associated protease RseP (regulator of RpoE activity)